jgi:hypothetical protein
MKTSRFLFFVFPLCERHLLALYRHFQDAMLQLDRLVADSPAYSGAWNQRATLLFTLGRNEESLVDVQRVLVTPSPSLFYTKTVTLQHHPNTIQTPF